MSLGEGVNDNLRTWRPFDFAQGSLAGVIPFYAGVDDASEGFALPDLARLPNLSLTRCIMM